MPDGLPPHGVRRSRRAFNATDGPQGIAIPDRDRAGPLTSQRALLGVTSIAKVALRSELGGLSVGVHVVAYCVELC